MAKKCLFCGGAGPFTGEHVFPDWTARLIKVQRLDTRMRRLGGPVEEWRSNGSFGLVVNGICRRCNSGWMSDLETLAKPILGPLILAEGPRVLSVDQQTVLAAWLWKIAMLHERAGTARYFTAADRAALANWEDPPSSGLKMWISVYAGQHVGLVRGGPSTFVASSGQSLDGFVTTVALRHFTAQVLAIRHAPKGPQGRATAQYNFNNAEVQIWPTGSGSVQWPATSGSMDDAVFNLWHERWNTPVLKRR